MFSSRSTLLLHNNKSYCNNWKHFLTWQLNIFVLQKYGIRCFLQLEPNEKIAHILVHKTHLVWPPRPGLLWLPLLALLPALSALSSPSPRCLAGRGRAEHDVGVLLQERGPHESPLREALRRLQGEAGPNNVVDVKGADWGGKKESETVFRMAIYMFDLIWIRL